MSYLDEIDGVEDYSSITGRNNELTKSRVFGDFLPNPYGPDDMAAVMALNLEPTDPKLVNDPEWLRKQERWFSGEFEPLDLNSTSEVGIFQKSSSRSGHFKAGDRIRFTDLAGRDAGTILIEKITHIQGSVFDVKWRSLDVARSGRGYISEGDMVAA